MWALIGASTNLPMLFVVILPILFVGPVAPYTRTIISNSVPAHCQAKAFAGIAGIEGIASFLSNVFGFMYSASVGNGTSWFVYAVFSSLAVASFSIVAYVQFDPHLRATLKEPTISNVRRGQGEVVAAGMVKQEAEEEGGGEGKGEGGGGYEKLLATDDHEPS